MLYYLTSKINDTIILFDIYTEWKYKWLRYICKKVSHNYNWCNLNFHPEDFSTINSFLFDYVWFSKRYKLHKHPFVPVWPTRRPQNTCCCIPPNPLTMRDHWRSGNKTDILSYKIVQKFYGNIQLRPIYYRTFITFRNMLS